MIAGVLTLLGTMNSGCRGDAEVVSGDLPAFAVISPKVADTTLTREFVGEIHAVRYAEIPSRLMGYVESLSIDEGQHAKSGQLLFTLRSLELEQELRQARAVTASAQAQVALAKLERDNSRMLFESEVVSSAELELAEGRLIAMEADLEETRAAESQAAIHVTYAEVRAPFDGVVNRIPKKPGSAVSEGEVLTTIADTSEVFVYFRVSEREYLEHVGRTGDHRANHVTLVLADGSHLPDAGVIDALESEISRETGSLAFRARFPNPEGILKHGGSGKVVLESEIENALLVPQKSTFEVQGRHFVFVLDDENATSAREIVPSLRAGDAFVVASGIGPGERFVYEGIQKIKEGLRIEPIPGS